MLAKRGYAYCSPTPLPAPPRLRAAAIAPKAGHVNALTNARHAHKQHTHTHKNPNAILAAPGCQRGFLWCLARRRAGTRARRASAPRRRRASWQCARTGRGRCRDPEPRWGPRLGAEPCRWGRGRTRRRLHGARWIERSTWCTKSGLLSPSVNRYVL